MSTQSELKSGLKSRHLTMISLAGVIGGALFIGSGNVIYDAGPAAILAYILGGALVMLIMRMLGEMAVAEPDSGSFSRYADHAIGRWAGFTVGWLYWCFWAFLMGWEAYVAGTILHSWFPVIPIWVYMLLVIGALVIVNLLDVKHYGEFEFWFALIKVVSIILFLVIGSAAMLHLWPWGDPNASGISHLTDRGFMPNGGFSVITALLVVMFSYMGAEIVTVAAAESQNPAKEIHKATKSIIWRIMLFYVGSVFVTVCLIPYDNKAFTDPSWGTYSVTLTALGIPQARHIVNFVVLTSVCSCFNSALYTNSRMMFSLAKRGDAHRVMGLLNRVGSPWVAVLLSCTIAILAVCVVAITDKIDIYNSLMQTTGAVALYVYLAIALSQLRLRKKLEAEGKVLSFKMWCFPYLTYLVIFFIIASLITMVVTNNQRYEVIYTSILAAVIVLMGVVAQKYNLGTKNRAPQNREP